MNPAPDKYPLLYAIESPADLRRMSFGELPALAAELREFLIQSVSTRGGHFAAGLGTVELTIALHYVFDTPRDRLVWDVGHQAYPHKVLTGRRDRLHTVKQEGGLAPFPTRSESEYDTFGVGHSSTSISAALGMAVAAARAGDSRRVVAVIGDGAMTAGMAFEALNHAGSLPADLLVILNDNDMSISENVGALSNHFARALSGRVYAHLREGGKKVLRSEEHTSELQSRFDLVCRLLLEKKKAKKVHSIKSSSRLPEFTVTNQQSARAECACIARHTVSLPVHLSHSISMLARVVVIRITP